MLHSYVDTFKKQKVLVVGDIMLDKFQYGKVERISPEAPVPIFKLENKRQMLGGAGNVVANLAALGCKTMFCGIIGNDAAGQIVCDMLQGIGVHLHVLKLNTYPTIVKTRIIANNNHLLRIDQEDRMPFDEQLMPKFRKIMSTAIKWSNIVLLSDYNKGCLTPVVAKMIIEISNAFGKPVIVDPKGDNYEKYSFSTLVKPNLKEFCEACRCKLNPSSDDFYKNIVNEAKEFFAKYHIKNLLVTLSELGMVYITSDASESYLHIPSAVKEVFDVSGAGDTVMATLGAALGSGATMKESMQLANIAAGIALTKLGTAIVTNDELKMAISNTLLPIDRKLFREQKIISLKQAKSIVTDLHKIGKKVGFTNGCFDCCHYGHISSFIQAKQLCDVLIVAVNSDSSIKRYKGTNRPIQDEKTRATLLASLEFVDYVIIFEEDSPLHIVETLHPDVVAKEGYKLDEWPEGRLAISYGGQAITLKRVDGYSTSDLIEKMKR